MTSEGFYSKLTVERLPAVTTPSGEPATASLAVAPMGELVAVAGQLGNAEPGTSASCAAVGVQVRTAFANLAAELGRVGLDWSDVLRFNTYLVGREAMAIFHEVRRGVFAQAYPDGVYPPNTTVLVAGLFQEHHRVEIEALAVRRAQEGGSVWG